MHAAFFCCLAPHASSMILSEDSLLCLHATSSHVPLSSPPLLLFLRSGDAGAQLSASLRAISSHLHRLHMTWAHALNIHLYLADMAQFASANKAYVKEITERECVDGVPSRATVEVPLGDLPLANGVSSRPLVMVDVLACKAACASSVSVPLRPMKEVLHVKSISHWAPSCIGPYSQVGFGLRRL